MAKNNAINTFKLKPRRKLGRHKKHKNKHESFKPYKGQGKR